MSTTALSPRLPNAMRAITADADEASALRRIVEAAIREIPGSELGGISALVGGSIRTRAASHPQVELIDRAQYKAREGPCLTAAVAQVPVVVCNDLLTDRRWPAFGRTAVKHGVHSVISFKLFDITGTVGALNLYSGKPHAFLSEAEETGSLLAAHAAVVMAASRQQANLAIALETRDAIGQAKGILMERYKLDDRQAFDALIAISQHTHRKLREIADQLRTTGEVPGIG
ncbi:MAG TPA: GAF and ANTAR domain-containing protein [Jatrophihabitans sp.]|nr:GAF and ANTAR domain-containing protein [Jatrophihabitans sp.]